MEYRIRISTFFGYHGDVQLTLLTEFPESSNGLLNIINSDDPYLSQEQLMMGYFQDKKNKIIKNITTQNSNDDIIICVDYFLYDQNQQGEYYYDEWRNIFHIDKKDFNRCPLKDKIGLRIQEINGSRKDINNLIIEKLNYIKKMNQTVKPTSERIIRNYLKGEISSDDISMPDFSFKDFKKYIEENPTYIKEFIKENWRYKKMFDLGIDIEAVLILFGGPYSFYMLSLGEKSITYAIWSVIIGILISNFIASGVVSYKFNEIENLRPDDIEKVKQKKLEL